MFFLFTISTFNPSLLSISFLTNTILGSSIFLKFLQNEDAYFYLSSLNLRIEKLLKLQKQYQIEKNMDIAIENMKPKVFWKDKPIFIKQVGKWNLEKLEKAKKILIDTEIKMKTRLNNYNNTLIKNLIINLYRIAKSTS